jgi:hypothetical protein
MADNVGYTPGSGATVAADDIGGVLYQRVKPVVGVDGVAVDVSDDAPLPVADKHSGNLLTRILQMLMAPLGYDKSLQRQRGTVVVETGNLGTISTVTTVTTVAAVTSLNNIDTYNARMTVLDTNRTAWAQCVRARIT